VYVDEIAKSELLIPAERPQDVLRQVQFRYLLQLMRETTRMWWARVAVEGCERQRAEEIGELGDGSCDRRLALAAPKFDTRSMSRLDSTVGDRPRSGVISEATWPYYQRKLDAKRARLAIVTGTLADILCKRRSLW